MRITPILALLTGIGGALTFDLFPNDKDMNFIGDAGPKMMFSKYIKEGRSQEAKKLSLVTELKPNIPSYAGYFTVDDDCDSNLFFWFFPSQNDPQTDPLCVWLQGGPGSTSFYGALTEIGPYNLKFNGTLELREYAWNRNSSFIFIDNPVGTGYSYAGNKSCYATNQTDVARDLLNALGQFFQIFPEYKANDFYISGTSFAGHYVPALAYAIHTSNSSINLKGIAIGNGWTDPENQMIYSELLYQFGLVDDNIRNKLAATEAEARQNITAGNFTAATTQWLLLLDIITNATGYTSVYDIRYPNGEPEADLIEFVNRREIRKALHVGNATWHAVRNTYIALYDDITRSYRPWLETLMDNYRVLLYSGQMDIVAGYPLTSSYLKKLQWSKTKEYQNAERKIWRVEGSIAGYFKSAGNFTDALVRNAGHLVPVNQPQWAYDLFCRFLQGRFNQ